MKEDMIFTLIKEQEQKKKDIIENNKKPNYYTKQDYINLINFYQGRIDILYMLLTRMK